MKYSDPILANIITNVELPDIESTQSVFHDLMSCIIEQQIHYRSTKRTFAKMMGQAGLAILTPENFHIFEEKSFGSVKLSAKKYETINNILSYWSKHILNWEELTDQEVRTQLSEIKGVGQWTIDMILIYTLNRPDVFSFDDFHIKQIMTALYELNPNSRLKSQMKDVAEQWSPQKTKAFLYLLEWKKAQKKTKH